jgi:hypothetical protein
MPSDSAGMTATSIRIREGESLLLKNMSWMNSNFEGARLGAISPVAIIDSIHPEDLGGFWTQCPRGKKHAPV